MISKTKKSDRIESDQREQYDYARRRINQKKNLMRHFIAFLAGCSLIIIVNPVLGYGNEVFFQDWYIWAILIWAFIFIIHCLNVFLLNTFMGKEWENKQLERLKIKQAERIAELQKKVEAEFGNSSSPSKTNSINNPSSTPLK